MKSRPKRWWEVRKRGWWRAFRNIPVFWLHQRTTYMDRSEFVFHLALNVLLAFFSYFVLFVAECFSSQWTRLLAATITARTISYIFNDHFWGGLLVSFSFVKNCGRKGIQQYLQNSKNRLSNFDSIHTCTVYGSIVRDEFHDKSDLDIRYIRRSGFLNALLALSFATRERIIALFSRIPLDLYVGDTEEFLDKLRDDEMPIVVKDTDNLVPKRYSTYVLLEDFMNEYDSDRLKEAIH